MFIKFFFFIVPFMSIVKKYCAAGQATDDNMAHAHFMLDKEGYKRTQNM